jgi:K+-transporting ATPase KdpF subunit
VIAPAKPRHDTALGSVDAAQQCGRLPAYTAGPQHALPILDYVLGGIVVAGLLIYLVYALLRPERF